NGIAEFAATSQHAYKKVMLTGCGTDQHAGVPFAQATKSNPVAPREPGPRGGAFIPMQDDGFVGRPLHGRLLLQVMITVRRPLGKLAMQLTQPRRLPRLGSINRLSGYLPIPSRDCSRFHTEQPVPR